MNLFAFKLMVLALKVSLGMSGFSLVSPLFITSHVPSGLWEIKKRFIHKSVFAQASLSFALAGVHYSNICSPSKKNDSIVGSARVCKLSECKLSVLTRKDPQFTASHMSSVVIRNPTLFTLRCRRCKPLSYLNHFPYNVWDGRKANQVWECCESFFFIFIHFLPSWYSNLSVKRSVFISLKVCVCEWYNLEEHNRNNLWLIKQDIKESLLII